MRRRPHIDNPLAFNVDGAILHEAEISRRFAAPRTRRSAKRDELRGVDHEERLRRTRAFLAGLSDLVRPGRLHPRVVTPAGSDRTMNAFPPAARIAAAVSWGRSESATMLPPPPAPVSFAPSLVARAADTTRSSIG